MDFEHVSPSQIGTFYKCGEQWRRRYIEKEIIPPGIALIRGSSVHKAAEVNHRQKIATRKDLSASDLKGIAAATFDEKAQDGVYITKEEKGSEKRLLGGAKDFAIGLTDVYSTELAPSVQPVLVEFTPEKEILIPNTSIQIKTVLDVFAEGDWLFDLKTASKSKTQLDADENLGLTAYSLILNMVGYKPEKISMETLVVSKSSRKLQSIVTSRGMGDWQRFLDRAWAMIQSVKAGTFTPAAPGSWACDPKWCGYSYTCKYSKFSW